MKKRILSLILAFALVLGTLPSFALAAQVTTEAGGRTAIPVVTESTVIFDASVQGAWNSSITISKLLVEGVTVTNYAWEGDTCIVTLAADTPKDAAITFSYEGLSGGGSAGAVYINGDKSLRTVNLVDGAADVKVRTASKFSSTSMYKEKTVKFQLEGAAFVPVERIEITNENPVVTANGGKLQLVVKVYPENATVQDVTWSTSASDTSITLNETGLVMGQTMGMGKYYTVTATSKSNPEATATIQVFLDYKMETAITISQQTMTLQVGESGNLSATVTADSFAGNSSVTWSSSDESIATVASGKVTGLKNGTVTITATSYHGLTATCEVTVEGGSDECDHNGTATTPVYAQVENTETHTVTVLCECGEKIGEVTTENCVDANKDGKCDKCAGAVTTTTPVTKLTWWVKGNKVTEITANVGDVVDAVSGCTPKNTAGNVITYTSADPEIVSVNNAEAIADEYGHAYMSFTALKTGETTVTATAASGVQGILNVKVVDPKAPTQIDGVYQIATADNLLWFADAVNGGNTGISAVLTADIDLTGKEWAGIGTDTYSFAGSFDGQNKTVTFDNAANGLFARVLGTTSKRAEIKNVITAGIINADAPGVAGIAGKAQLANITGCVNNAEITNVQNYTAGIVGWVYYGNAAVTIRNCSNHGAINTVRSYVGGIMGQAGAGAAASAATVIENCYNTATITANNYSGGITGELTSSKAGSAKISNCYNTGAIKTAAVFSGGDLMLHKGTNYAGIGAIGKYVAVENCYNTGSANYGLFSNVSNAEYVSVTHCYYLDTAATTASPIALPETAVCGAKTAAEISSEEFATLLGEAYKASCPAPVFTWQTAAEHEMVDGVCENCGFEEKAEVKQGDVDGDDQITAKDATAILVAIVSQATEALDMDLADMDGDDEITAKDATEILKIVVAGNSVN